MLRGAIQELLLCYLREFTMVFILPLLDCNNSKLATPLQQFTILTSKISL